MPKLGCVCGYVHDLSPIPDHGHRTISDRDYETHFDDIRASLDGDTAAAARMRDKWGLLYECPECGRLAWLRDGSDVARVYVPQPRTEGGIEGAS